MYACVHVCVHACVYMYVCVRACLCVHVDACVYVYVCMYVRAEGTWCVWWLLCVSVLHVCFNDDTMTRLTFDLMVTPNCHDDFRPLSEEANQMIPY